MVWEHVATARENDSNGLLNITWRKAKFTWEENPEDHSLSHVVFQRISIDVLCRARVVVFYITIWPSLSRVFPTSAINISTDQRGISTATPHLSHTLNVVIRLYPPLLTTDIVFELNISEVNVHLKMWKLGSTPMNEGTLYINWVCNL